MKYKPSAPGKTAVWLLIFLLLFTVTASVSGTVVRIGILGDRTGGADDAVFTGVVTEMARLRPDMVINVGDLIEGPQPDAAAMHREWDHVLSILSRYKCPFYYVPGNNDIFDPVSRAVYTERTGAKPYYSFDFQGIHFIVLDNSEYWNIDDMDDAQMKWLDDDLKQNTAARLTCVFFHKPFWYDAFEKDKPDRLHEMFVRYGVDWVFSGHFHRYVSTDRDGIHYVMVGSSGGHVGNNPAAGEYYHYGMFIVSDDDAEFSVIRSGAVIARDSLTLKQRMVQDRLEESFVVRSPVVSREPNATRMTCEVSLADSMLSSTASYLWNTDGTPWRITPGYGTVNPSESDEPISVMFTIMNTGLGVYPLPELVINVPLAETGRTYPLREYLTVLPRFTVPAATAAPVTDGALTDPAWKSAISLTEFGGENGAPSGTEPFTLSLTTHQETLHIAVDAVETEMNVMLAPDVPRDGAVFQGDCIYLIFWSGEGHQTITQLILGPDGALADARGKLSENKKERVILDKTWNGEITVKSQRSDTGWSLELAVPLEIFRIDGKLSEIRYNTARYQTRKNAFGALVYPITYSPELAGTLIFH